MSRIKKEHKDMKIPKRFILTGLICIVVSLVILFLDHFSILFVHQEYNSIDRMFYFRNPLHKEGKVIEKNPRLNEDVVLVIIDDYTRATLKEDPYTGDALDRFLQRVTQANTVSIHFDLEFERLQKNPLFLAALKEYFEKNRNIFFNCYAERISEESSPARMQKEMFSLIEKFSFPMKWEDKDLGEFEIKAVPGPMIIDHARGIGHPLGDWDLDGVMRKEPAMIRIQDRLFPSVIILLAMHYYDISFDHVEIKRGKYIQFKQASLRIPVKDEFGDIVRFERKKEDITIPVDDDYKMFINYSGWGNEFKIQSQFISLADAFKIPFEYFNNKVVFVGSFNKNVDLWHTPHGFMYGVEVLAHSLNTIIQRDFLKTIPGFWKFVFLVLLSVLTGIMTQILKIWQSALYLIGSFVAIFIISHFILFGKYNIIFPVTIPFYNVLFAFLASVLYRLYLREKEIKQLKPGNGKSG
ncbi:MAG: CHASE2 domain-containing protein [Spirochaetes bacterium]|nr:CHASE2 domain-containing protein [Spirochaetota bacterium]